MTKKTKSSVPYVRRYMFFRYDPVFDKGVLVGHGNTKTEARRFLKENPGGWVRDLKVHMNLTLDTL